MAKNSLRSLNLGLKRSPTSTGAIYAALPPQAAHSAAVSKARSRATCRRARGSEVSDLLGASIEAKRSTLRFCSVRRLAFIV